MRDERIKLAAESERGVAVESSLLVSLHQLGKNSENEGEDEVGERKEREKKERHRRARTNLSPCWIWDMERTPRGVSRPREVMRIEVRLVRLWLASRNSLCTSSFVSPSHTKAEEEDEEEDEEDEKAEENVEVYEENVVVEEEEEEEDEWDEKKSLAPPEGPGRRDLVCERWAISSFSLADPMLLEVSSIGR